MRQCCDDERAHSDKLHLAMQRRANVLWQNSSVRREYGAIQMCSHGLALRDALESDEDTLEQRSIGACLFATVERL